MSESLSQIRKQKDLERQLKYESDCDIVLQLKNQGFSNLEIAVYMTDEEEIWTESSVRFILQKNNGEEI